MTAGETAVLREALNEIRPLSTLSKDGLVLIALEGRPSSHVDFVPYADAPTGAVEIRERSGGEVVGAVEAVTGGTPVVIFAGDTIVGGKQNRIVNVTIWLKPNTVTPIPVTCLEHGRWDTGRIFGVGRRADYALREIVNRSVSEQRILAARPGASVGAQADPMAFYADQGGVWSEIAHREARAGHRSSTSALHDLYEREAEDGSAFVRALPCPAGATGVAVGIGGNVTAVELFDAPEVLARQWSRIVEGAAFAHFDHRRMVKAGAAPKPTHRHPDDGALGRLLGRAVGALEEAVAAPSVGDGTDIRFRGPRVSGAALVRSGGVVHAEIFRVEAAR